MEITVSYKATAKWEEQPTEVQTYDAEPQKNTRTLRLTDEVSASSYGIPVLIDESGRTFGPSDQLPGSDQSRAANDLEFAPEYLYGSPENQAFIEKFIR
jgi:hypothetical protein